MSTVNLIPTLAKALLPLMCSLACLTVMANPDTAARVELEKLLKEGKNRQAMELVEQRLATHPEQPELWLVKGVLLAESKRDEEAKQIFQELIVKHPQLPEPYNNLAVLYAREGNLAKARATLELAIKSNPAYAIAYENLGDIYARLANDSYARAINLQPGTPSVPPKLRLIRQVVSLTQTGRTADVTPDRTSSSTRGEVAAGSAPSNTTAASETGRGATKAVEPATQEAVLAAIERWRSAWSSRDMTAYVAAYIPNYSPDGKTDNHDAWVKDRRQRIVGKSHITLELDDVTIVSATADEAIVRFRQRYQAPGLSATTRKELRLRLVDGQWRIAAERTVR